MSSWNFCSWTKIGSWTKNFFLFGHDHANDHIDYCLLPSPAVTLRLLCGLLALLPAYHSCPTFCSPAMRYTHCIPYYYVSTCHPRHDSSYPNPDRPFVVYHPRWPHASICTSLFLFPCLACVVQRAAYCIHYTFPTCTYTSMATYIRHVAVPCNSCNAVIASLGIPWEHLFRIHHCNTCASLPVIPAVCWFLSHGTSSPGHCPWHLFPPPFYILEPCMPT